MEHGWPGNIRQLGHVLRSAAALADGKTIQREHLSSLAVNLQTSHARSSAHGTTAANAFDAEATGAPAGDDTRAAHAACTVKLNPIQANERQVLLQMLEQHRWNVSNVAKALDVSRNTLYRKLHKLHIEISHPEHGQ
jgi:sigma-54 dependent transcriptional regulator, acetoin dehydrogenase operon transcriptional activator AcoR